MDILGIIYQKLSELGIYRYGWVYISAVLVIPAIVSVNMLQSYLTDLFRGKSPWRQLMKPIIGNGAIAFVCCGVIIWTIIQYTSD